MVQEVKSYKTSAFTVDVEDGVSIAMRDSFGMEVSQTDRVVTNTRSILNILARHNVNGTFFILGKVGRDFPKLIREIDAAGHEVGVHGYQHHQFFKMTPDEAYNELSDAKKILEDITGKKARGHRAPAFSITASSAWALDVVAACGFEYDSSIMPIKGLRYGWENFPQDIVEVKTNKHYHIIEAPLSTIRLFGKEIPYSGGGYLRLFPFLFTNWAFSKTVSKRSAILYLHPHELDYTQYPDFYFEQLKKAGLKKNIRLRSNWLNRGNTENKLNKLLTNYQFSTMQSVIEEVKAEKPLTRFNVEKDI